MKLNHDHLHGIMEISMEKDIEIFMLSGVVCVIVLLSLPPRHLEQNSLRLLYQSPTQHSITVGVVGSLLWYARTARPDVMYATN